MGALSRIAAAIFIALFAGLVTAGERADANTGRASIADQAGTDSAGVDEAWIGDYRVHDASGERTMTVIRDASRVEYRLQGAPIRVWRQVSDGVELQELHPDRGEMITYAPGDLRARGTEPAWGQISSLVDPALRDRLAAGRSGKAFGESVQRYRGRDAGIHSIELDWLTASAMPARYRIVAGQANETGTNETIELRSMRRLPVVQAFTPIDGLREKDAADLGD
jgi:hypothetical protein